MVYNARKIDSEEDFAYRNTNRIDIGQIKAIEFLKSKNIFFVELGFGPTNDNDISAANWFKIPPFLRNTPDLFFIKNKWAFMEVKGCRDSVKIKFDDYLNYLKWNEIAKLWFFVYSTIQKSAYIFTIKELDMLYKKADHGIYKDNKKRYFEIHTKNLTKYRRVI